MADTTTPDTTKTTPEAPKKGPEKIADILGVNKTPESIHGEARSEAQGLRSEVVNKRLAEIAKQQKVLEEDQKKTAGNRPAEDWTFSADKNTQDKVEDIKAEVVSTLDEPEQQQLLEKMGLSGEKYKSALNAVFTAILNDRFHKMDVGARDLLDGGARVKNELKSYAKGTLLPKIQDLFGKLETINNKSFKEDKSKFLERFSDFTQTNFMKNGELQETELKTFLLLNSYEDLVKKFDNYSSLTAEKEKLEGKKPAAGAQAAPEQKPEAPGSPEKPGQQPATAPTAQPAAAPGAAPAAAADAKKPAEKPAEPFDFGKSIMDLLKWLFGLFGMNFGLEAAAGIMKEWKDATEKEKKEVPKFFDSLKEFFPEMGKDNSNIKKNILNLLNSPEETRKILHAREESSSKKHLTEDEPWKDYLASHLSRNEQRKINSTVDMDAKSISPMLVSEVEFEKGDLPAELTEQKPAEPKKPAAPGTTDKPAVNQPPEQTS